MIPDQMWYYSKGEHQQGPVPQQELVRLLRSGSLGDNALVWREGMAEWQAAFRSRLDDTAVDA